uniref:Sema domain, immunoglobulin domain (Ig), short basic domain, secreted, (semaphorin) 3E n=1 Tax=Xiphophorus couchianus TaxID=32473 RepID=A0A3B5MYW1_9TELE
MEITHICTRKTCKLPEERPQARNQTLDFIAGIQQCYQLWHCLWQMNRTWIFQGRGVPLQPQTMLLDESHQRLYVGAKNALFSLNLDRVNAHYRQVEECMMKGREKPECANYIKVLQKYNQTHLLVCGTGAFNPICALVKETMFAVEEESVTSGKGRCPFDPNSSCMSTLHSKNLIISLLISPSTELKVQLFNFSPLSKPKFVGSAVIPDNDDRDDNKVYFFFTERETDGEGVNRGILTHIGRVCANDQGGQRMLVNRWSSFLKTRLICSVPGPNGIDTHFDNLEDVFVLTKKDEKNPEIFGLFSTTSAVFKGYAVCMYHMEDIRAAFNGPFAYREKLEHHWTPYEGRVPYPRPGSCASKVNGGGFSNSKEFPDEVLRFVRSHPVMYRPVLPHHHRPILLQSEPGRRKLTQIAVDKVQAQDGHYHVLYIGTDDSVVLKVITIYNKDTDTVEEVLLEELQIFKVVHISYKNLFKLNLYKLQQLYVGSEVGVAQIRLHQCDLYGSACADCCLARDPYCAWDGLTCSRYYPAGVFTKRRFRRQDIRHGNAVQLVDEQWQRAEERLMYSIESNTTLLECVPRSLQAKVLWFLEKGGEKHEVIGDERVIVMSHGLLFLHVRSSDAGMYVCQTVEHGYVHTLLRINLHVLRGEILQTAMHKPDGVSAQFPASNSRVWYKEFLQLIGYGDAQKVEEYCERVWCSDKKRKKTKMKYVSLGGEKKGKGRGEENSHRAPRHTFDT